MVLSALLLRVQLSSPSGHYCPQPALAGGMRTPPPGLEKTMVQGDLEADKGEVTENEILKSFLS